MTTQHIYEEYELIWNVYESIQKRNHREINYSFLLRRATPNYYHTMIRILLNDIINNR